MAASAYSNPMEWVGIAHNAAVRYAVGQLQAGRKKPTEASITKITTEYFSAAGITISKFPPFERHLDVKKAVAAARTNFSLTSKGASSVSALLGAVIDNKAKLSDLLREIERQEHVAAKSLEGRDLRFFQALASVARHSATLWTPKHAGGEGFGDGGGAVQRGDPGAIVGADCLGLGGGLLGAAAFSILAWAIT